MKMVFLGPPGSGKGTQAEFLSITLRIAHISTGELLRQEIADNSALGIDARRFVESGALVPDDLVMKILEKKLGQPECSKGFILDGFPRNIPQAENMIRAGISVEKVFYFDVPEEQVVDRLGGRLYCSSCGAFFHERYNIPAKAMVCDRCSNQLIRRADDEPDAIRNRMTVYREKTMPLINYYKEKNLLTVLDASRSIDEIRDTLLKEVGQ